MKKGEKYKTAEERAEALLAWCSIQDKSKCQTMRDGYCFQCAMKWLDLEAEEEKPLPCPFCGGACECKTIVGISKVECQSGIKCRYQSGGFISMEEAIAAHNRVARAVMAAKEKEAK